MKANPVTVRDLFDPQTQFAVPRYQRSYTWNQEEHWEPLWQDILEVTNTRGEHFLGPLILKQLDSPPGKPVSRRVVDGQQRLTTLQIVISAVSRCLAEFSEDQTRVNDQRIQEHASALDALTSNPRSSGDDEFKIKPFASIDFRAFKSVLNGMPTTAPPTDHPMVLCYAYFYAEVCKFLSGQDDLAGSVEELSQALHNRLYFFALNLEHENEYVIYETLNARGAPLTLWDKAKNHLLSKATEGNRAENQFYDDHVAFLDSVWWQEKVATQRFEGARVDQFLYYWLIIRYRTPVKSRSSWRLFRKLVDSENAVTVAQSITQYAAAYSAVTERTPGEHDLHRVFREHRRVLRSDIVMPLVMELRVRLGDDERFRRCVHILDSYLCRRAFLRSRTNAYDKIFMAILQDVHKCGGDEISATLLDGLSEADPNYDWPDDETITDQAETERLASGAGDHRRNKLSAKRIKLFLDAIERHLTPSEAGYSAPPANLTLEHVMPVEWKKHWPLQAGDDEQDFRDQMIGRLGNLTLATGSLNANRLSNGSWQEKRKLLRKQDNLFLNKDLLEHVGSSTWDEHAIAQRGRRLGKLICEIWPSARRFRVGLKTTTSHV